MFKAPFLFSGRIRRTEYLLSIVIYLAGVYIFAEIGDNNSPFIDLAFLVIVFWFFLAQSSKRCHDLGHSGWFKFIPFYFVLMLFLPGNKGANKYGPDPKEKAINQPGGDVNFPTQQF